MNSLVRAFFDLKFVTKYQLFDRISKSVHFSKQYSRYTRRKEISCFAPCNRNSYDTLRDKIFAYQAFVLRGIHCIRGGLVSVWRLWWWFRVGKNYGARSGISTRIDILFPPCGESYFISRRDLFIRGSAGKLYPFREGEENSIYLKGGMKNGNWPPRVSYAARYNTIVREIGVYGSCFSFFVIFYRRVMA